MTILPRYRPLILALSVVFQNWEGSRKMARLIPTLLSASYRKTPRDTPLRVTSQFKAFLSCPCSWVWLSQKQARAALKTQGPTICHSQDREGKWCGSQPTWETELTNSHFYRRQLSAGPLCCTGRAFATYQPRLNIQVWLGKNQIIVCLPSVITSQLSDSHEMTRTVLPMPSWTAWRRRVIWSVQIWPEMPHSQLRVSPASFQAYECVQAGGESVIKAFSNPMQ